MAEADTSRIVLPGLVSLQHQHKPGTDLTQRSDICRSNLRLILCILSPRQRFRSHILSNCALYFQWVPEISHHCQKTPFLLVGTQIDLRDDAATIEKLAKNKQKPLSLEMGEKLAKELRAVKYVECSALTQACYFHDFSLVTSPVFFKKNLIGLADSPVCKRKRSDHIIA